MMPSPPPVALEEILRVCRPARLGNARAGSVRSIVHDSRRATPGCVFFACHGERSDGFAFLQTAVASGAIAVVVSDDRFEEAVPLAGRAVVAGVSDTDRALSRAADRFYDHPSGTLRVAGVTGTNGKTTTTFLLDAIVRSSGLAAARIGTLGASFEDVTIALGNTTPLAPELQGLLYGFARRGAAVVSMEVSSHALARQRVADIDFAVGAFTNLTRDHLDFHETMEAYAAAKRRLFDRTNVAVLNADDPYGARWAAQLRGSHQVVTYGMQTPAQVRAESVNLRGARASFTLDGTRFELSLPGAFNVSNALCAIACARALGIDDAESARALRAFDRVPGRMESLSAAGVLAIVDYAHTPDALERVLTAARGLSTGKVTVVFGCGGDRDAGKRPHMGEVAGRLADRVYITSDNSRSEDPAAIASAIVRGITDPARASVELDRRSAIRSAIEGAAPGDVVVVAGKGHEPYQITGDRIVPFDDRAEVQAALSARAPAFR